MDHIPEEALNRMAESYFREFTTAITRIYVDLEMIFDLRVGAILMMIGTEDEYKHIRYQLPIYSQRFDTATVRHFPELGITEANIDHTIQDPLYVDSVVLAAPPTDVLKHVGKTIADTYEHNRRSGQIKQPITLDINCNSMRLGDVGKTHLINAFKIRWPQLQLTFSSIPLDNFTEVYIEQYPVMYIRHIGDLLTKPLFLQQEPKARKGFWGKRVYSLPIIEGEYASREEAVVLLKKTEVFLNMFCDFAYVYPHIVLGD